MFDARLRPLVDPPLEALARGLVARGVTAEAVTWAGFVAGGLGAGAAAVQAYGAGLILFLAGRVLDGLDGAVARASRPTDRGGFLDITLDFLVYSGMVLAFAVADPGRNALAAAFLIFAFVGTGSSFLAFAALAAQRGQVADDLMRAATNPASGRGRTGRQKAIAYLGGLTEGTETILALALCCLLPGAFPVIAGVFGLLCLITTATRIRAGMRAFADPSPVSPQVTPPQVTPPQVTPESEARL